MTVPWKKIKEEIKSKCPSGAVLAVSGGIDSVFMLDFLSRSNIKCVVAYFDHGLGNGDTSFVKSLAEKHDLNFVTDSGRNIASAVSIEAEARNQRYTFFEKIRNEYGFDKIITGHNRNDQVETIIMRLTRGFDHSTLGMSKDNGTVYRPFLDVPREAIEHQAKYRKLKWLEDQSNNDLNYERNWVRHVVVPLLNQRRNVLKTIPNGLRK